MGEWYKIPVFDLQKPEKNTGILWEKTGFLRKKTGFSQNRKKMGKYRISGKKTGKMGKYRKTGISDEKGFSYIDRLFFCAKSGRGHSRKMPKK